MVRRHELTDQAWAQITPLLPSTGAPAGSGPTTTEWSTGFCGSWPLHERLRRWQADGTWRGWAHAKTRSDAVGEVDWDVVVDATIVWAHQHAAGARKGDPAAT